MEKKKIDVSGYGCKIKTAKAQGNSSGITLPVSWLGSRVCAILLDDNGDVDGN